MPRSAAGSVAHLPVDGCDLPCSCGRVGCLQAAVGEKSLVRRALTAGLITVSAFGAYTLLRVNYLAYSVCITAFIAFMLTLAGIPEPVVAVNRVIGTIAGGFTALVVHSAWSASERWRIQRRSHAVGGLHQGEPAGH